MNCEEVSKHLTEYLDKTLDTAMTTRVATHVISCTLCRAESNELADCIQQVASLPAMDPPLGFAQRVMAHVRDSEPRPSLWQRFIAPLSGRVPLPATALAMVALFALALYQTEPSLKSRNDIDLALTPDRQPSAYQEKPPAAASAAANTASETPTEAAKEGWRRSSSVAPAQTAQLQPAAPAPLRAELESASEDKKAAAARRPPLRVQEVTAARDGGPMLGDPRGFNLPLGLVSAPRPVPLALERSIPLGDRVADFEFVVRRRAPQRPDAVEQLGGTEPLQKSNQADQLAADVSRPAVPMPAGRARIESIAEIRFYNVAPEHFEIFKKELAAEANIELEPKAAAKEIDAAKQADRQLLVKVTILPPDTTTPSR